MALPISITDGLTGATRSCSKVPSSLSLATESPARTKTCAKLKSPMIPGMKNQRVIWFGLYHVLVMTVTGAETPVLS